MEFLNHTISRMINADTLKIQTLPQYNWDGNNFTSMRALYEGLSHLKIRNTKIQSENKKCIHAQPF